MSTILPGGFSLQGPQTQPLPAQMIISVDNGLSQIPGGNPGEFIGQLGSDAIDSPLGNGALLNNREIRAGAGFFLQWTPNVIQQVRFLAFAFPNPSGFTFRNSVNGDVTFAEQAGQLRMFDTALNPRFAYAPVQNCFLFTDTALPSAAATFLIGGTILSAARQTALTITHQGTNGLYFGARFRNLSAGASATTVMQVDNDVNANFFMQLVSTGNTIGGPGGVAILQASGAVPGIFYASSNPAGFHAWSIGTVGPGGERMRLTTVGLGVGLNNPSAALELRAGTAAANGAPFKYRVGVDDQTVLEDGAKNFDGGNEYLTVAGVNFIMAKTLQGSANLDFPSTPSMSSSDLTVNIPGVSIGDTVTIGCDPASVTPNGMFFAFVDSFNSVTIRYFNFDALAQDPAAGDFTFAIIKP